MTRYAWYKANWPYSMRELATRLQAEPFTSSTDEGFFVERVRENALSAIFYRKIVTTQERQDPFGKTTIAEDILYQEVKFLASKGPLGLTLTNPPRGIQRFVAKMLQVCEFNLTVGGVSADVLLWADFLQQTLEVEGYIDTMQLGEVALDGGAVARVVVRGLKDVREPSLRLIPQSHTVEKVQLRLRGQFSGSSIVLGRGGVAKVSSRETQQLGDAIDRSLELSLQNPV